MQVVSFPPGIAVYKCCLDFYDIQKQATTPLFQGNKESFNNPAVKEQIYVLDFNCVVDVWNSFPA